MQTYVNENIFRGITIEPGYEVIKGNEIKTGDFIRVHRGQTIPCDILLLDSSDSLLSGIIANIDETSCNGTTHLTIKKAFEATKVDQHNKLDEFTKGNFNEYRKMLSGTIKYSKPKVSYKDFEAFVSMKHDPKIERATFENLLTRGSVLKTSWVIGLALYVGNECKGGSDIVPFFKMNRKSYLEKVLNKLTITLLFVYIVYCVISRVVNGLFVSHDSVLYILNNELVTGLSIVVFMILY